MYDLHDLQCLYFLLTQFVSSHRGSYRSITFFVSQIATVLHKREPEDGETRVMDEDEATISAEECQGHLRDMPVIKDFLTKFTV